MSQFVLRPIGEVRVQASDDDIKRRGRELECESRIEIFPEYQDALDGLTGFSHIFVLSFLDRLRPDQVGVLKVKPRRLVSKGFKLEELPLVGVFAILSHETEPDRPELSETAADRWTRAFRLRP